MTIPWLRFVTISHTNVIIFLSLRWLLDEGFKEERQGLQFHMKKHDQKHKVFTYFKEKIETFTETAYFVKGSGVCFTFISEKFYCSCIVQCIYVLCITQGNVHFCKVYLLQHYSFLFNTVPRRQS